MPAHGSTGPNCIIPRFPDSKLGHMVPMEDYRYRSFAQVDLIPSQKLQVRAELYHFGYTIPLSRILGCKVSFEFS